MVDIPGLMTGRKELSEMPIWLSTRLAPLLAWISMILWVASRPSTTLLPTGWALIQRVPRRLFQYPYHLVAFFVLAVLFVRCLAHRSSQRLGTELMSLTGSLAVSITSELVQIGTPTRTSTVRDVGLDLIGMWLGVLFMRRRAPKRDDGPSAR
jgi:VanZ family protein